MKIFKNKDSKYLWILDAGHGGLNASGQYVTPGKRSPVYNGQQIYEGVSNRQIVTYLEEWLTTANIDYVILADGHQDKPLIERTKDANGIYRGDKRAVLVSVHSNAGGGRGIEVFTSPGQTESDAIATRFIKEAKMVFPEVSFREDWTDEDPDKEAKFWMLRKTAGPAILTENFFMDSPEDFKILNSEEGRYKIALYHFNAILKMENDA